VSSHYCISRYVIIIEGLDKGGQGPTSGCCAIEEEEYFVKVHHAQNEK
jgi:hypothetical protein